MEAPQTIVLEPPLYFAKSDVRAIQFHPCQDVLAAGLIDGTIQILKYSSDDVNLLLQATETHKKAVRSLTFNQEGTVLCSLGADGRIGFMNSEGNVIRLIKRAHQLENNPKRGVPLTTATFINSSTLASGDEEGKIKIWDCRTFTSVLEAHEQPGAISSLRLHPNQEHLFASCEDGTVALYDLRQASNGVLHLEQASNSVNEQLFGLEIIKDGRYVISPTSEGSLLLFRTKNVSVYADRIQGLPGAVSSMLKIDENTVLVGCEDGYVRGVSVYPNSIISTLGQHEQEQNYGIESLSLSHCRRICASASHDASIKFYDINNFVKERSRGQFTVSNEPSEEMPASNEMQIDEQGSGDDDSDSDDSDGSSDEQEGPSPAKQAKPIKLKMHMKQLAKEKAKNFFKDL